MAKKTKKAAKMPPKGMHDMGGGMPMKNSEMKAMMGKSPKKEKKK